MHLQLPDTLKEPLEQAAKERKAGANGVAWDRVERHRRARKGKFSWRKGQHKHCYSELSEEHVTAILTAIRKAEKAKAENFVFADDI